MSDARLCRVLVVDDQPNWRNVLGAVLRSQCEVRAAASLTEAEKAVDQGDFDVGVFDIRLDDRNPLNVEGLQLLQYTKRIRPKVGVILMTAFTDQVTAESAEQAGADAFIRKGSFSEPAQWRALIREVAERET